VAQGIVIAGTHSGCGKTTVTLGLLAALQKKGLKVQSFKAGPDFIDAGLHKIITGRPSRNLDLWMCKEDYVRNCFHKNSIDADISIIEGVMGMYDGGFSTARLASFLELPVILVVDAYGMAESAGAVVKGFMEFIDTEINDSQCRRVAASPRRIVGVIFNRVASDRHYERLKDSVNGVTVLGYLPRDLDFEIPHRHLGLTVAEENPITGDNLERLVDAVLKHCDVEKLIALQNSPLEKGDKGGCQASGKGQRQETTPLPPFIKGEFVGSMIAVAYDKAFCFYYEDNIEMLRDLGAEVIKFSPISDPGIPDGADCLYIGGGYPELYAEGLSKNISMLKSVNEWASSGRPIYAECGGLMYLSQGIYDFDRNFHKMACALPFETQMKKGRSRLGYREIALKEDCILGRKDSIVRGHEFHYSEIINSAGANSRCSSTRKAGSAEGKNNFTNVTSGLNGIYSVQDSSGRYIQDEGHAFKNILASYMHIHFGSNPEIADNFMKFIKEN